ncbi:MAG: CvpA family protein [Alphaproteobacteria bacterium]|nr:CvpA family protein [Alphaproteobacteria bacterium]
MSAIPFTMTDGLVVAIILLSGIFAFFRGFVKESLAIGAWVGAALAALYGFKYARPIARQFITVEMIADVTAAVVPFIASLIVLSLVSGALSRRVQDSRLSAVDRSLGFLFGVARGAVIVCLALLVVNWAVPRDQRPEWISEAKTLPAIERGAQWLLNLLPREATSQSWAAADDAKRKAEQAMELKRSYDRLVSPPAQANPGAREERPGYTADQRRDLDGLVRKTQ